MGRTIAAKPLTQQIEESASSPLEKDQEEVRFLPTPITLMNLACADDHEGGFQLGKMVNLIGDSSSGKTILAISCFAEANLREAFDHYRFIYDDVENACEFDLETLFGEGAAARIEPPQWVVDEETGEDLWCPSDTIEDFHCNIMDALEDENPCIYVLDSFDALDAEADQKKVKEFREARKKDKKAKGTYGMAKPKKASEILRQICAKLKQTDSILIIVSQTRDNIDPMSFQKKTRSGGNALKFYATHEIWLAMAGELKSKEIVIGHKVRAKISKNKITGKKRKIDFAIYDDLGIDNTRSMVWYHVKAKSFSKSGNTISAKPLNMSATEAKLVNDVEVGGKEKKLRKMTARLWKKIEESVKLNRQPRYR